MKYRAQWFAAVAVAAVGVVVAFSFQSRLIDRKAAKPVSNPSAHLGTPGSDTSSPAAAPTPSTSTFLMTSLPGALQSTESHQGANFSTGDATQRQAGANDTGLLAVKGMLRDYRAMMGENPIGNNAEIAKALLGGNSRGVQFSNSQMKLDKDGQLVDRWNHPYFFHQLSQTEMEIRSAGPDGIMWTGDDEVSR